MILIESFDDCLKYVNSLGLVSKKNCIAEQQKQLCEICDNIRNGSGQSSWYEMKPFKVHFRRKDRQFLISMAS